MGRTVLHYLMQNYSQDCPKVSSALDLLLNEGADPNIVDNYKHTPLTLAIQSREILAVSFASSWN